MSLLFPVYRQARCAPVARAVRHDFAPLLSLIDDAFAPPRHQRRAFAPRFDVSEAHDFYQLEGELPGVEQKDITVEFTDEHTLSIRGRIDRANRSSTPAAQHSASEPAAAEAASTDDTASVASSKKATVEDEPENEWTDVASANASEAGPSTATVSATSPAKEAATAPASTADQPSPGRTWVSERFTGEFSRSFSFADRVNQDAVTASLQNGVLSIVVPKAVKPENRKITVA